MSKRNPSGPWPSIPKDSVRVSASVIFDVAELQDWEQPQIAALMQGIASVLSASNQQAPGRVEGG